MSRDSHDNEAKVVLFLVRMLAEKIALHPSE